MTAAINEICIGWLLKNCCLLGEINIWLGESTGKMNKFSANGRTLSWGLFPSPFPPVGKTLRNMENHKK